MFRRWSALLILLCGCAALWAQESFTDHNGKEYFFYVPEEGEMQDYFRFMYFLQAVENGEAELEDVNQISWFFDNFYGQSTLHGLAFDFWLLNLSNPEVRDQIIGYLDGDEIQDNLSEAVRIRYRAEREVMERAEGDSVRFNYLDSLYDEDINLFFMGESSAFNGEFGLMLFDNPWGIMSFNSEEGVSEDDSFILIHGGGTNSVTINFDRYRDVDADAFFEEAVTSPHYSGKYGNWTVGELSMTGMMERSGADRAWICFGTGPDIIPEIDTGAFEIHVYSESLKRGYSVSYFMNFSSININYPIRHLYWNRIFMQLPFVFINVGQDN